MGKFIEANVEHDLILNLFGKTGYCVKYSLKKNASSVEVLGCAVYELQRTHGYSLLLSVALVTQLLQDDNTI